MKVIAKFLALFILMSSASVTYAEENTDEQAADIAVDELHHHTHRSRERKQNAIQQYQSAPRGAQIVLQ